MRKTVLITGCSSGIGRATAHRFLDANWDVYASARDPGEIRSLADRGCRTVRLDVTDDASVTAAVDRIFDERGRLDCLVNNAGYGQFGATEDIPIQAVIDQFDVNTFGPLRLTHAVLPVMRQAGRGRIINVTAGVGSLSPPGLGIYTASKYALESATDALRQEVSRFGVDAVIVEPGIVATDFYDRALDELDEIPHTAAYDDLYRALGSIGAVQGGGPGINSPDRVAETILRAASVADPRPKYRVGPVATVGSYAGRLLRGTMRDRASQIGLRVAASDWVQRPLRRRQRQVQSRPAEVRR